MDAVEVAVEYLPVLAELMDESKGGARDVVLQSDSESRNNALSEGSLPLPNSPESNTRMGGARRSANLLPQATVSSAE